MNVIDCISIIVIIISAVISFFRGFLQELSSIFIWIVGVCVFFRYYSFFSIFSTYVRNIFLKNIISYIVFFVFFLFFKSIFDYCIIIFIEKCGISLINKIFGMFFGIIRGVLFLCIVLFFLELLTNFAYNKYFKNSFFVPYFNCFIKVVIKYLFKKYILFKS
ncbi:colicin V production-like protein [Buchnera aphidicola str. Bp (Baizongia pistaciae)]|uniref:Colicin V production protein homolog n=1 Tax=Buchnera aphidicola subsp. Baizongia pistaciae (strain Bp) TaxID=224915 RepID=CVPA_BUCBP|nr:RecName: Full=Colicin V production protein homolog [Buchnera aphidicola str. Bp (Baizongia pistaciae)]AAO26892.1 colicin V production-like protein [Buchnera aphidicola str. Bp (Baizongia pistaciae)]